MPVPVPSNSYSNEGTAARTTMICLDMIYGYIGSYGHSATSSADAFQQLFQQRDSSRKQYFFVSFPTVFTEAEDVDENGWKT